MTTLKFTTVDQHLVLQRQPVVASGDKNSVLIQIQLCSMWDGFDVKVAFYKDGNRDFVLDIPLENGECMIPPEMLDTPCVLNIGVWGKDARGRHKTSTMVKYRVHEGTPIEAGLTLIDVSDGTAAEDQVLEGATFFAGDTEMKAGNIKTYEDGDPVYMTPYTENDPTVPAWAKQPNKPKYTAEEVGARPNTWTPTESDPTVPDWAKQPAKPTYTAAEIGAAPAGYGEGTKQDGEKGYFIAGDSIGWYRIATARSHRFSALVSLWHEYGTGGSSDDLWYVSGVNMAQCLRCLGYSASIPALVDNIRVVNTGGYNVAVDVYCRLNAKNGWSINIINTGIGYTTNTDQSRLRLQTPVFIGADDTLPEGETLILAMEWENPPMELGVEYRTTERYMGKPVYTKAVDCGELPIGTNKVIEYGDSQCRALFCYGACGGTTIPTMNFGSYLDSTFPSASIISLWGNANTLCIACGGDRSGISATVIVKYWKTTD